jgi:large subunit ribosomal protein L25
MEEIQLEVQIRKEVGSRAIKKVRREDFIPGNVYGPDIKPLTIKTDRRAYERITRLHHGGNVIFHINVMEGNKKTSDCSAIVKEEQLDPVTDKVIHIDFSQISLEREIEIKVPIEPKGEAVGVKADGGSLEHNLWELEVVCLPTKIPKNIILDVSLLKIGDAIHIRDIVLPEGVRTKHDPDAMVLSVVPPMKEEVAAPEAAEAPTEPEVIREKKPEEGEAEAKAEPAEEKKEKDKPKEKAKD